MPAILQALVALWEGTRLTALHERFFACGKTALLALPALCPRFFLGLVVKLYPLAVTPVSLRRRVYR